MARRVVSPVDPQTSQRSADRLTGARPRLHRADLVNPAAIEPEVQFEVAGVRIPTLFVVEPTEVVRTPHGRHEATSPSFSRPTSSRT
jgi:hypothetical protein